jgi:ribosomal protein S18 acetylase RimI-like enzyme
VTTVRRAAAEEVRSVQLEVLRPFGALVGDTDPPPTWLHLAAERNGAVVGACSLGPAPWPHPELARLPEPTWQLRSMAVLPDHRGGVGALLLAQAVRAAAEAGAGSLWAQARVAALTLYLRGDWLVVGPQWLKPGIGPHRWITLNLREGQ